MSSVDSAHASHSFEKRVEIGFLNWAHAIDHYVLGIYPTLVIGLQLIYQRTYSDLIVFSTAMFVAFGVCSLPAGWLADRWSRRNMMVAFYLGCGLALGVAGIAPNLIVLAVAMCLLGVFAAIYHPVGMAMLVEVSQARGRTLAFNGVCGNLGVALAAGITAVLASWLGWRGAFIVPGVICIVTGLAYLAFAKDDGHRVGSRKSVASVAISTQAAVSMFLIYIVISICGGLTFNTVLIALPKIVDERLGQSISLLAVGGLATAVFLCGAIAQLIIGRLIERFPPHLLFAIVAGFQLTGIIWAVRATGMTLILALALAMAAIYAQITVGDIVVARYTADAWRGRVYAVRFFLTFISSAIAVSLIAFLHERGGFDLVLMVIALVAAVLFVAVSAFATLASGVESRHRAAQPAE